MITKDEFNSPLLKCGISIAHFARLSGKRVATIKKYTTGGVPDKSASAIDEILTDLGRQMHIEEYIESNP